MGDLAGAATDLWLGGSARGAIAAEGDELRLGGSCEGKRDHEAAARRLVRGRERDRGVGATICGRRAV